MLYHYRVGTYYFVLLSCELLVFCFVQQLLTVRLSSAPLPLETGNKAGGLSLKPCLNGVNSRERAEKTRDEEKMGAGGGNGGMGKRGGGRCRRLRGKECYKQEGREERKEQE